MPTVFERVKIWAENNNRRIPKDLTKTVAARAGIKYKQDHGPDPVPTIEQVEVYTVNHYPDDFTEVIDNLIIEAAKPKPQKVGEGIKKPVRRGPRKRISKPAFSGKPLRNG